MIETRYPVMQCDMKISKNMIGVNKTQKGYTIGCDLGITKDSTKIAIVVDGKVKHIIETEGENITLVVISMTKFETPRRYK